MSADTQRVRFVVLPYDSQDGNSMVDVLIAELGSGRWSRFRSAVAYGRLSANWPPFVDAIKSFANSGNTVSLTFGANTSGGEPGTDFELIQLLLEQLPTTVRIFLYHEPRRLFHPKIYLFDNEAANLALIIIGSTNWTGNGLTDNVEANVALRLDLKIDSDRQAYEEMCHYFCTYWQETEG